MLKYIELKTGFADNGPAWVARVKLSKSGRTVYFNGRALKRADGGLPDGGNHYDIRTRESFWVSGVKKDGSDRHWAGSGRVSIERSAVPEYLERTGRHALDERRWEVIPDLPEPDPSAFVAAENAVLTETATTAERTEDHHPRSGRRTTRCS